MDYLHNKIWNFIKNIFSKKKESDKVKIIFNMPREDFREMLEKDIIPHKIFSVALGKEEVLRLMENKNEYELNFGDFNDEIMNNLSLEELEREE